MADAIAYHFTCGNFAEDTFEVIRFTGEEGISQLYRFQIDLISDDAEIDVDDLQDEPSTFTITGGHHERRIQGVAAEVDVLDQVGERTIYRVVIVPRVWELTLTRINAVYLDRTTPEILGSTLEEHLGITEADYRSDLDAEYRSWPFRLQYGESYWEFVSRLMERDGIYYYFVPGEGGEQIVFCDRTGNQPRLEEPEIPLTAALGMATDPDFDAGGTIDSLIMRQRRQPRSVWVQNYNDDKPSTPVREQAEVDPRGTGEVNLYGQNVLDPEEARTIAEIRAEELRCTKAVYHGESTAFRLAAGCRFDLTGHRRAQNNREYQLVSIEHSGHSPSATSALGQKPPEGTPVYENRFTAIPADTQYRAPRETDWPSIRGTLNAQVDAEGDGRFAELDEEGRYHIVFPFHRGFEDGGREQAGKASHWVRMVQPYSGSREGMHFPLRKGTRVLIGFVGGNPDLPVITGAIPTAEQISVTGSENQTKSNIKTQNNRIELDDNAPRIKLQSRKSRSYFHLGSSNAPGDGVTTATDGLNRLCTMGGNHQTVTTYGWPEGVSDPGANHPLTTVLAGAALESLNTSLSDVTEDEDDLDWSEVDANEQHGLHWPRDEIFTFPVKHDPDDINQDLEEDASSSNQSEDGRHDLFINRTVGVAYQYRLGIDFQFQDTGNEVYEFGPKATYSTADQSATPADLRRDAVDLLPGLMAQRGLEDASREAADDIREARVKLKERQRREPRIWHAAYERARELVDDGMPNLATGQGGGGDEPIRIAFVKGASDDDSVETWLELNNLEAWAEQLASHGPSSGQNRVVEAGCIVQEIEFNGQMYCLVKSERSVIGDLESKPDDDPADESIRAARKELEKTRDDHNHDKGQIEKDSFLDEHPHIDGGRIEVSDFDAYRWHFGNIYDFGGCWNYNLGNGYEENHIDQDATLDRSDLDRDLLKTGGPDWTDDANPWTDIVNGVIKAALQGNKSGGKHQMLVSKTLADTYDYHQGAALDVQVGPSLSVKKGGPNVEKTFSGTNILAQSVESADGVTRTTLKHPISGELMSESVDTWGDVGKSSFSVTYSLSNSLSISMDASQASAINLSASTGFTLNVGASYNITIDVGAAYELNLAASAKITYNFSAAFSMNFEASAAFNMNVKAAAGGDVNVDAVSGKVTGDFPSLNTKVGLTDVEKQLNAVTQKTFALENQVMNLRNGMQVNS